MKERSERFARLIQEELVGILPSLEDPRSHLRRIRDALDVEGIDEVAETIEPHAGWRLWTDDFNNIVQVLKSTD